MEERYLHADKVKREGEKRDYRGNQAMRPGFRSAKTIPRMIMEGSLAWMNSGVVLVVVSIEDEQSLVSPPIGTETAGPPLVTLY